MDKTTFDNASHALVKIAMALDLGIEFKPNFNDEVDFVINFGTEAIDYNTLENPTCTNIASYLVITMPKVDGDGEAKQEKISQYHYAASKLMEDVKPQYLLDVQDGHVGKLMWCVWA